MSGIQAPYLLSTDPGLVPIESIKEIRTGVDARYHREQFQLSQDYEDRWLTIIYILDGNYKTLHLIVTTREVFRMWEATLRQLHAIRKELMTGLGNLEVRQALWEKQYWKGADEEQDQKLTFEEVEKLCKRLNINSSQDDLYRLFTVRTLVILCPSSLAEPTSSKLTARTVVTSSSMTSDGSSSF